MKKIILLAVPLILICGCSLLQKPTQKPIEDADLATEQDDSGELDGLAEFEFNAPDTEDGTIHSWTKKRVEESLNGKKTMVRIPAIRNYGWGCTPPSEFCLGLFSGGGCVYLKLIGKTNQLEEYKTKCAADNDTEKYCSVHWGLEGYFTGKTKTVCVEPDNQECCEPDQEYEFYVTKTQLNIDKNGDYKFKICGFYLPSSTTSALTSSP